MGGTVLGVALDPSQFSIEPGALLERARPGFWLTMQRPANGTLILEARNTQGKVFIETVSREDFESALRDRSSFNDVLRRAVEALIERVPYTVAEGKAGTSITISTSGPTTITLPLAARLRNAAAAIRRTGQTVVTMDNGSTLKIFSASLPKLPAMTEGEVILAGRRGGKSFAGLELDTVWVDEDGPVMERVNSGDAFEGTMSFGRMDGISGVSEKPQPEPLLPRPARVYCED